MNILIWIGVFSLSLVIGEDLVEMDGYKYLFSGPFKANWYMANQYCRYRGMYLIEIPTYKEHERVLSLIKLLGAPYDVNTTQFWTSGSDLGEEGHFVWMSSGDPILFRHFHGGQPDNYNTNEHCLELRFPDKFLWNDIPCIAKIYFICRDTLVDPHHLELKSIP